MTITPSELEEIRERCARATPGPWCSVGSQVYSSGGRLVGSPSSSGSGNCVYDNNFISHARSDIPRLLEEIERLKAALTAISKHHCCAWVGMWPDDCGCHAANEALK